MSIEPGMPSEAPDAAHQAERNVVILGAVALFSGAAQEMIYPLLPAFVILALHGSKTTLGAIEGALFAAVALSRIASGWALHRGIRPKTLTSAAYAISVTARPLLALAPSVGVASALRVADGIGKGGKDAPRDSLVADAAGSRAGRAFGVQRALDTLGSVIGPLIAAGMLLALGHSSRTIRIVFAAAAVPGLAALLMLRRVQEPRAPVRNDAPARGRLPAAFWGLLAASAVFGLANSSDTLLLLRAQSGGVSIAMLPVLYAAFNLVYAAMAIPAGVLADRFGKRPMLVGAWVIYSVAYAGFAFATHAWQMWGLFLLYGLYYASAEGTAKAWVATLVPPDRRGVAYSLFATATGVLVLPAGVIAGSLWDRHGARPAFLFGSVVAMLAAVILFGVGVYAKRTTASA